MADKLTDMIDEMVSAKTFSLDALDGVRALKTKAAEQERLIEALNAKLKNADERQNLMGLRAAEANEKIEKAAAREKDLTDRESKVRHVEMREAVSTARATALTEVFGTIFRNPIMRETTMRSIPQSVTQPGGYQATVYQHENETVERTTE